MSTRVMVRVLFLQRAQLSVGRTRTLKLEPRKINVKSSTEFRQFREEEKNVPHKLNSSVSSSLITSGRGAVNWGQGSCTWRGLIK